QNAPDVYEQIKRRVREGRWEVNGGMWVEADCNIASGEALIRQFLYGIRFFKDEFSQDNDILWLPDVFGYSAALPQIMQKCGLPYFMTTKISWNEFNKIPYDTFMWEGIDGTKVLTHFIPTRDYSGDTGAAHASHFTTYNGYLKPLQVKGGWKRYQQKHINSEALMAFGYGDGGGGPTKDMLENQRRLAKGIPGCPITKMSTAGDFFKKLEKDVAGNKYLPTWTGELYLEYHRGTYTSMARNKKSNRQSEFMALNTELYALLAEKMAGSAYPQDVIDAQWEIILRNQFHDILPGSSIKEVYDDSKAEYEGVSNVLEELASDALAAVAKHLAAPKGSLIVFNPNGFDSADVVETSLPNEFDNPVLSDGNNVISTQKTEGGMYVFRSTAVPGKGYKTYVLQEGEAAPDQAVTISPECIDTPLLSISLNKKGQFTSIYDKAEKRELLKKGQCGNVLMSYEDKPHNYDAWDVNNYYTEKSWEIGEPSAITVCEAGTVRYGLRIDYPYLDSKIVQVIHVYPDSKRIDIKTEIDWKEKQIFVKALFPFDIHADSATYDIQYGNVIRPTHFNTSWDFARFEVCCHKWLDISEDGYGVSVLNDCKYGCSAHDGVVGISLLKSAVYPNPEADKEKHHFTYSLYPHKGTWKNADTVKEAYRLNNPMRAIEKRDNAGSGPAQYGLVTSNAENVIVEAVKKAQDSDEMIIRLYECYNRRTSACITFGSTVSSVYECDMLEQGSTPVNFKGNTAECLFKPYEIKTLRVTLRD
ncbi:MAG: glycosyl hydrolase-related protein, partial [Oscillospiraceae bacterium]|nr:glycosyl hydrolase-related protein [Oscillospiraceae bacterium]